MLVEYIRTNASIVEHIQDEITPPSSQQQLPDARGGETAWITRGEDALSGERYECTSLRDTHADARKELQQYPHHAGAQGIWKVQTAKGTTMMHQASVS